MDHDYEDESTERHGLLSDIRPADGSINSLEDTYYVVYKRRWYILATVMILNFSNAMIWITYSPIADITSTFYNTTESNINWLALVFPIATVPFGFTAIWVIDSLGLRVAIILAAWLNLAGSGVRVLSAMSFIHQHYMFPLVMIGQTIAAIAQPFLLFVPTKLAATWFGQGQRATANMLSSMANPVGIMIANILSPQLVEHQKHLPFLMQLFTIPAGLGALMATLGLCHDRPPTPPTASAEEQSSSFCTGLKMLLRNKMYWVLALSFGLGMGLVNALFTLLEQMLCPRGYSDKFAGLAGALFIVAGVMGAAVAGLIVDKTKKFEEVAKVGVCFMALSAIFFACVSHYERVDVWIIMSVCLFGMFAFALYPVSLELGVETSYPVAEATSSGFLIISGQIQGILFVIVMQLMAPYISTTVQTKDKICGGNTPQDYEISNLCFAGVAALGAVFLILGYRCPYRRLQTEQQIAAEKILDQRYRPNVVYN